MPRVFPELPEQDFDVAIVGFGPVGALTALLLAEAGLRVVVLERSTDPVELPRAVALDGESVRTFQRIGLAERVVSILQPPRAVDEVCFVNSRHERLLGAALAAHGPSGWRDVAFFDQPELEAMLREEVAARPGITVCLGHEATGIADDGTRVTVQGQLDGGEPAPAIRARLLVGCDGASSFVRRTLAIPWTSLGYDQDWLVVDIVIGPDADLPETTMQVCDPHRLTTYVCVKDPNRRWEFQLRPGETREEMLEPERIRSLLDAWLPADRYTLRRAAVYQFHAATAECWRAGRVLLAGDAAHQTPPFLGQGLNAGFRDAANLGWKIPLVLSGLCDASLLDSYEEERDPHARDLVERAVGVGKLMENFAAREAGRPEPHTDFVVGPPSETTGGVVLRSGIFVRDPAAGDHAAGRPLFQPTVRAGDGRARKLDALLGAGFAIVGRKRADCAMGPEAAAVWRRLDGRVCSLEDLTVTAGQLDRLFDAHPAAVVRPDRYVFGVVDDAWTLDALVLDLARRLALH